MLFWRTRPLTPFMIGSLIYMSPFLIFRLKPHSGLVQTHALYFIDDPWLPKSERGTKSPTRHLRHLGNPDCSTGPPPNLLIFLRFASIH